jgi:Flp pilus assembly protein TadG
MAMQQICLNKKRRERGGSIVEVALLAPWIFFLFVGIFDFGFYAYAAICTQNAARAVAIASAQTASASVLPCTAAIGEMRMLPNVANVSSTCSVITGAPALTSSVPINVCVALLSAGAPTACNAPAGLHCADCGLPGDSLAVSYLAVVSYRTVPLVPIPGILTGQLTVSRAAEERQITP